MASGEALQRARKRALPQYVRNRIKDEAFGPSPRTVAEGDRARRRKPRGSGPRITYRRNPVSEGPIKRA